MDKYIKKRRGGTNIESMDDLIRDTFEYLKNKKILMPPRKL